MQVTNKTSYVDLVFSFFCWHFFLRFCKNGPTWFLNVQCLPLIQTHLNNFNLSSVITILQCSWKWNEVNCHSSDCLVGVLFGDSLVGGWMDGGVGPTSLLPTGMRLNVAVIKVLQI